MRHLLLKISSTELLLEYQVRRLEIQIGSKFTLIALDEPIPSPFNRQKNEQFGPTYKIISRRNITFHQHVPSALFIASVTHQNYSLKDLS